MVKCALPAGSSATFYDAEQTPYTFNGVIGVAPEWQDNACGVECQEWMSSCLLAHINLTGLSVPLWLDASHDSLGWGISDAYPRQEGAYFGNIFAETPVAYACKGRDADVNPVAGRLCLGQEGCPYVAIPEVDCESSCESVPGGDGFTSCEVNGRTFERPVTVWTR